MEIPFILGAMLFEGVGEVDEQREAELEVGIREVMNLQSAPARPPHYQGGPALRAW